MGQCLSPAGSLCPSLSIEGKVSLAYVAFDLILTGIAVAQKIDCMGTGLVPLVVHFDSTSSRVRTSLDSIRFWMACAVFKRREIVPRITGSSAYRSILLRKRSARE